MELATLLHSRMPHIQDEEVPVFSASWNPIQHSSSCCALSETGHLDDLKLLAPPAHLSLIPQMAPQSLGNSSPRDAPKGSSLMPQSPGGALEFQHNRPWEARQGNSHMPQQSPGGALCRSQLNGPREEALGGSHARGADDEHHGRCGIRPGVGHGLYWQTAAPGPGVGPGLSWQSAPRLGGDDGPCWQQAAPGAGVGHDPCLQSSPGPSVGHNGLFLQVGAPAPLGVGSGLCHWQSAPARLGGNHGISGGTAAASSRWGALEGAMGAPPLVPGRQAEASDSGGAYGGVAAHEAAKLRSREAQRKVRQRHKVRRCPRHWEAHLLEESVTD